MASTVAKKSITIDRDLYEEVESYAQGDNFSRTVNEALSDWVLRRRGERLMQDVERELGPVPAELSARVRSRWPV